MFRWDEASLISALGEVRNLQGRLVGQMEALGFDLKSHANLETLTSDVLQSSQIEGEVLDSEQVRSSVARKLGLEVSGLVPSSRDVDGVVEMMLNATQYYTRSLSRDRLFEWHRSLFPAGQSGSYAISVGRWRDDAKGPMQVVSGPMGRERVHFEAPAADLIEREMRIFLAWLNDRDSMDPVIRAALAHLWFLTIHPFDDGNGRIARAISDMLLARSDRQPYRFYSMSSQILKERSDYYDMLEQSQKGGLDITEWMGWYLGCLQRAVESSAEALANIVYRHHFWQRHGTQLSNKRQQKVLNKLLDGFEGKLTSSKYARMCKCSPDTALRDIQDLIQKGVLMKLPGGGRSTGYGLKKEG